MKIPAALVVLLLLEVAAGLNSDGNTLLGFKRSIFSDPERSMGDWEESDATPCRWGGVRCETIRGEWEPRVVGLELSRKRLIGSISSDLGSLAYLQRLDLSVNQLIGVLPPQLFNATSLQSLILADNDLSGPIPASVSRISDSLTALDVSGNGFSGSIPASLLAFRRLEEIDLSGNRLTGTIPDGFGTSLKDTLKKLDVSSNSLSGPIPDDIGELGLLSGTLNLSENNFSGPIPATLGRLPISLSIDLSNNNLSGAIPLNGTLSNQGPTAFLGNPGLCGMPLKSKCTPQQQLQVPLFGSSPGTRLPPGANNATGLNGRNPFLGKTRGESGGKHVLSTLEIVVIAVGDAIGVLLLMAAGLMCYFFCRTRTRRPSHPKGDSCCWAAGSNAEGQSDRYELDLNVFADELGNGELLHFDAEAAKLFDLDALLRASAYVLGKGSTGIVYKAVLEGALPGAGPTVMVVRRLGDGGAASRRIKEFEAEVKAIGGIRHPNVVPLRAYYWGMNEKLLVYDYMPNGSLAAALQQHQRYILLTQNQGLDDELYDEEQPTCLSWPQRLAIARGIARGLAHLHEGTSRKNLVHGNLKPSNVLLDSKLEPCVSDFGIGRLSEILATHEMMVSTSSSMRSMSTSGAAMAAAAADGKSSKSSSNLNSATAEMAVATELVRYNSPFNPELLQQQQQQQQHQGSSSSLSLYTASASIYRPPEAATCPSSKPTHKWDVYSFGVVLLELLTGSASAQLASSDVDMLASVRRMLASSAAAMNDEIGWEAEAMEAMDLALQCVSSAPEQRPKMKQVFEALCKIGPV